MTKSFDALVVLEEVATSLRESAEQIEPSSAYDDGRLMGYYEALSTLISQCQIADIDLDEIGLAGFKVDSLLGRGKKAA